MKLPLRKSRLSQSFSRSADKLKLNKKRLIDIVASLVFMGALWQLEIADLNLINGGVPFGYAFTWITIQNNWAVRDFWMLLMILAFITIALNGEVS